MVTVSYLSQSAVIKISKKVHDDALKLKDERQINYMDKKAWFSYLIEQGMKRLREENP